MIKYVPGMSDQNQPKLTLEEELDVLEAVYKVGKEKGLELLRPEQVKKLRDAGRMSLPVQQQLTEDNSQSADKEIHPILANRQLNNGQAQFLVMGLKIKLRSELATIMSEVEEWKQFNDNQREYALACYFQYVYGLSEASLIEDMISEGNDGS